MGHMNLQAKTLLDRSLMQSAFSPAWPLSIKRVRLLLTKDPYDRFSELLTTDEENWLRLESTVFENLFQFILYSLGRLERVNSMSPVVGLQHRHKQNEQQKAMTLSISERFVSLLEQQLANPNFREGAKLASPSAIFVQSKLQKQSISKVNSEIALRRCAR